MNIDELKKNKIKELENLEKLDVIIKLKKKDLDTLTLKSVVEFYVDSMAKEVITLAAKSGIEYTFDHNEWINLVLAKVEPNNQWYDSRC